MLYIMVHNVATFEMSHSTSTFYNDAMRTKVILSEMTVEYGTNFLINHLCRIAEYVHTTYKQMQ